MSEQIEVARRLPLLATDSNEFPGSREAVATTSCLLVEISVAEIFPPAFPPL